MHRLEVAQLHAPHPTLRPGLMSSLPLGCAAAVRAASGEEQERAVQADRAEACNASGQRLTRQRRPVARLLAGRQLHAAKWRAQCVCSLRTAGRQ